MRSVSDEQIHAAREVDLLTYLQANEPQELKQAGPGRYTTVTHGSMVISNGKWYWNRGGFGGVNALDYLVKVCGMDFMDAVEAVSGVRSIPLPKDKAAPLPQKQRTLILPPPTKYPSKMLSYLQQRGISAALIRGCMDANLLYEGRYALKDACNSESVCVFVGRDDGGRARFGCMRGIFSSLKRDCAGSDKRYGFHLPARSPDSRRLVVFEAPIDALSHAVLFPDMDGYRLSLGGTSDVALMAFLERHPQINNLSLCLDADDAGRNAAGKIQALLADDKRFAHITVTIDPPEKGKDYNEMLLQVKADERIPASRREEAGFSL